MTYFTEIPSDKLISHKDITTVTSPSNNTQYQSHNNVVRHNIYRHADAIYAVNRAILQK